MANFRPLVVDQGMVRQCADGDTLLVGILTGSGTVTGAHLKDTSLTSGRVVYVTTGGQLADSADLLFSGSALSIGTASTDAALNVKGPGFAAVFERSGLGGDSNYSVFTMRAIRTGQMADGFGAQMSFDLVDGDAIINPAAYIGAERRGADNSAAYYVAVASAGTMVRAFDATSTVLTFGSIVDLDRVLLIRAGAGGGGSSTLRMGTDTREWNVKVDASPYNWHLDYIGTDGSHANVICATKAGYVGIGTAPSYPWHLSGNAYIASGNLGITTEPSAYNAAGHETVLNVARTFTDLTATTAKRGQRQLIYWNPGTGGGSVTQYVMGCDAAVYTTATETVSNTGYLVGSHHVAIHSSGSTMALMYGLWIETGTYNNGADTAGTITSLCGLRINGLKTASSTISTAYGIYISGMAGSTIWDLYCADTGAKNYFAGPVGCGVTPTAVLHLKAGTAAAGTAPLKLTSGTLLSSAEAGAMEFLSDDLYFTITTGAARQKAVLTAGLTSGRVPYATTNGRLTDAAGLTSDGTNLTAAGTVRADAGFNVNGSAGIDASVTIKDGDGASYHHFTFTKGILTAYVKDTNP